MASYKIEIRQLKVSEYQSLRNTTDWNPIDDDVVKIALDNDLFSIGVFDQELIIGMGRVVGDGAIYFYLQDIIVHPQYQGKGIGKIIMDYLELFLSESASENSFIGLMAAEGAKGFYRQYGYVERSVNSPGMYKVM